MQIDHFILSQNKFLGLFVSRHGDKNVSNAVKSEWFEVFK